MVKIYLKQAWVLLKQNPLFSTLYIVGTGLAIAMTMIVAVIYYVESHANALSDFCKLSKRNGAE